MKNIIIFNINQKKKAENISIEIINKNLANCIFVIKNITFLNKFNNKIYKTCNYIILIKIQNKNTKKILALLKNINFLIKTIK